MTNIIRESTDRLIRMHNRKLFSFLTIKTYVVGTQNNSLNEHSKQMLKLTEDITLKMCLSEPFDQ